MVVIALAHETCNAKDMLEMQFLLRTWRRTWCCRCFSGGHHICRRCWLRCSLYCRHCKACSSIFYCRGNNCILHRNMGNIVQNNLYKV